MKAFSLDYLISEVNQTVQLANPESLRLGTVSGVRYVMRRIGIELVCGYTQDEQILIMHGKYRIPDRVMLIEDIYDTEGYFSKDHFGYRVTSGIVTGKRLEYRESPLELLFPNVKHGTAFMAYHHLYTDQQGNILIPEVAYTACYLYCCYKLLDLVGNPRNPKWQERAQMLAHAQNAIFEARGELNKTTQPVHRTTRILQ
ncbi:hypothetical protein [Dyadobacter sp. BHUBP1]|uniref:hypothetical protein n=1 Tax=Dyadobacter sp. BHUBP1 TaxID=3424178 RepID=UPI003D347B04